MIAAEWKRMFENLPDDQPVQLAYVATDGGIVHLVVAESWKGQGVYCIECEAVVTDREVRNA